ncbi:MAG TPA: YciI family protein [Candidatus Limnocylindria bacterium]|nr:YciI family protein [Candidatus Limnocylindria bacterium]
MLMLCDAEGSVYWTMPKAEREKADARIGQWWGDKQHQGVIEGGAQLQGPEKATTVRTRNGKPVITDGPFIEAKESIGGYAIVNVNDLDAALGLAREWVTLFPRDGSIVEVRPLVEREGA